MVHRSCDVLYSCHFHCAIVVGNEYLTTDPDHLKRNALVQAMQNLHVLFQRAHIHSMAVLASSFPPSVSTFATTLMPVMTSIVGFLADTGAPYMVNAYPYFAYRDNPGTVDLEYALLGDATGCTTLKDMCTTIC